ncbi:MAG: RNA-binding protein [Pseudomonadota bacterium]
MSRGGRDKERGTPERRCIATGATTPRTGLIRFAVDPAGAVVPDVLGKLPGRGIWVSADKAAIETATAKNLFSRAAKRAVSVPGDLPQQVEAAVARRMVELVSLARKAGQAVAGFEKVKSWLETGEAVVLLQASDGSEKGKAKLRPPDETGEFIGVLTASELGLAFGRENVIHGALSAGGLTARAVEEAARLSGLRENNGGLPAGKDTKTA